MNNKILIVLIASVVLIGGIVGVRLLGNNENSVEEITPTPEESFKDVDDSVQATLVSNPQQTKAILTITGFSGRFTAIEYELSYQTDNNGTQGAFSNDPIDIAGQDSFEREIELGSCSTGGKCTYDKGVRNFKLTAKLVSQEHETFLLKKEFPTLE